MKGLRILTVASAFFALATSAHANVGAAGVEVVELAKAVSSGAAIDSVAAVQTLTAAGFEAGAARALLAGLQNKKETLKGVDFSKFAAVAAKLDVNALSTLVGKLATAANATAFTAELSQISTTAPVVAEVSGDPELAFRGLTSGNAKIAAAYKAYGADKTATGRAARVSIGKAALAAKAFPALCAPANRASCAVKAENVLGKWTVLGLPKAGTGATNFFVNDVMTSFGRTYAPETIIDGADRSLDQGAQMAEPLKQCWYGKAASQAATPAVAF